ncbi:MAG: DUF58 domain-containing protein [Lachnospiraceae bacterium]|nr:DUF58 domain-containing protein [Lachnospiraceae bacterium]
MDTDKTARIGATNKKVHISLLHLVIFLLIYAINLLLFLAFRGYFFLIMGIIFTTLVPFSFYMAWRLTDYVKAVLISDKERARPGEAVEIIFTVNNPSFLCALRAAWFLTAGNSFYGTFDDQKLVLSIPPHGQKQFLMTVSMTDLGRIVFACKEFCITDLLGIFVIHSDCALDNCIFILPQADSATEVSVPETFSGAAELSESNAKGNDYSEVSDIRTYRAGDRPKDIHWKLSAKQQEPMVKERVSLSGSEHILLLDLPHEKNNAEELLTESYHQVKALLNRHMAIRLLIWNNHLFSFDSYSCNSLEELETAFCEIFHTSLLSHNSDILRQYMKNCYPQLESYMCMAYHEDHAQLEICING